MHNARFRLMAGLAGATLCLFAAASYGQNTSTQTGTANGTATTPDASAQTTSPTNTPATTPDASAQAPTTTGTVTTGTDTRTTSTDATTTTTTGFPGGTLGITVAPDDSGVRMRGPATTVFRSELDLVALAAREQSEG